MEVIFQSTRPVRGATRRCGGTAGAPGISIHAPRAGRDGMTLVLVDGGKYISIHAPRAGRDGKALQTPKNGDISIHAPRAGRDVLPLLHDRTVRISIHAPRAGRDKVVGKVIRAWVEFQSTRPVRGATNRRGRSRRVPAISIHAPRAGRDYGVFLSAVALGYFNPRAPCGARLIL